MAIKKKSKTPVISIRRKISNKVDERIDITLLRQELKDTQHKVDSHATFYNMHTQQIALLTRIANEQHSALMNHAELLELKTGMREDVKLFALSMNMMMQIKMEEREAGGKTYEDATLSTLQKELERHAHILTDYILMTDKNDVDKGVLNNLIKRSLHTANYCMIFFHRANKMLVQLETTETERSTV